MNAPATRRPSLRHRTSMVGVAVDDEVELIAGGRWAIDETQELQPFLMAMKLHARDHSTAV